MGDWPSALEEWLDYVLYGHDYAPEFTDHPLYPGQDLSKPSPAGTPRSPAAPSSPSQQSAPSSSPRFSGNSEHTTSSTSLPTTKPSSSGKSQHKTGSHLLEQQEEPLPENPRHSWERPLHPRQQENPVQMACRLVQYLANRLPIRSFFAFQVLSGISSFSNKSMTAVLVSVLAIVCFASCFTDSSDVHGGVYFRHVYIRLSDFVHAAMSTTVYAALVLSDRNVMDALYPCASGRLRLSLQWVRLAVVVFSALLLLIFPTYRQGVSFAVAGAGTSCGCDESLKGAREVKKANGLP
ncbi:hypothetical protein EUGRSUZ_E03238 [Eucalyptus grandis]|uniref:Uncharacterized protein n=2 Tax=Eucalyptus grandis TaxID=71139 RepID=A0ACC3KYU9_EUCGR|nr:hypothetical protein EUGRSUZ_E03238 [Eucalyptus grandis]